MKCIKCKTINVHNANYCKKCANQFSEIEQAAAEKWTIIGIIKRLENLKEKVTFGWLLDHWAFKIGSVLGVLLIGIIFILNNGSVFSIQESENYRIEYNEKLNEYYLYSEKDESLLNLYVPKNADSLVVKHYYGDQILKDEECGVTDNLVLYSNYGEDYYVLEAKYNEDKSDNFKLFIYHLEDGE